MRNVLSTKLSPSLARSIQLIEQAVDRNDGCQTGISVRPFVIAVPQGRSGGPEILALLYADDAYFEYWYGHVLQHLHKSNCYVALLVRSNKLVNGATPSLLMERFHYWVAGQGEYHPSAVQTAHDAYEEYDSLQSAANGLSHMVSKFDVEMRSGYEWGQYKDSPPEMRILSVYGLEQNEQMAFPMPPALVSVKALD